MFRLPIYAVLISSWLIALRTLYGQPDLLYRYTREDGPVEWATVVALLALAALVARELRREPQRLPVGPRRLGWALVVLACLAAAEEISWGQRVFGFSTGETMRELNYQQETNLHNLVPGELFNGLLVFTLGIGWAVVPLVWRRWGIAPPDWLPDAELAVLLLNAILINHYRFATLPEQIGIVVVLALLLQQTVVACRERQGWLLLATLGGWCTAGALSYSRSVLRVTNHQYEIRELVIVMVMTVWAVRALQALRPSH